MASPSFLRRNLWLVPVQMGVSFIAGGAFMIVQGLAAKREVREALAAEQITTSAEASIPRTLVTSAETAKAQSEVISRHTLRETRGRTYAQLPRGDPLREYYMHAVTLRTALGLAIMGFKVSDLVVGLGAFMAAVGGALIMFAPALRPNTGQANED